MCVDAPCVSSPRPHREVFWQSRCRSEGSRWEAAAPMHPSLDTPHSEVYSATQICAILQTIPHMGICSISEQKAETSHIKWRLTHRHAPVFIFKHVQKDLLALGWHNETRKPVKNRAEYLSNKRLQWFGGTVSHPLKESSCCEHFRSIYTIRSANKVKLSKGIFCDKLNRSIYTLFWNINTLHAKPYILECFTWWTTESTDKDPWDTGKVIQQKSPFMFYNFRNNLNRPYNYNYIFKCTITPFNSLAMWLYLASPFMLLLLNKLPVCPEKIVIFPSSLFLIFLFFTTWSNAE